MAGCSVPRYCFYLFIYLFIYLFSTLKCCLESDGLENISSVDEKDLNGSSDDEEEEEGNTQSASDESADSDDDSSESDVEKTSNSRRSVEKHLSNKKHGKIWNKNLGQVILPCIHCNSLRQLSVLLRSSRN